MRRAHSAGSAIYVFKFLKMEAKLKFKESILQDCEKTNLSTPFSINDILTKENDTKCEFENGIFFGGKMDFLKGSGFSKEDGYKKEVSDKSMKYYDDCNGYSDFADDGALDMSRKNHYPVTELSGEKIILLVTYLLIL